MPKGCCLQLKMQKTSINGCPGGLYRGHRGAFGSTQQNEFRTSRAETELGSPQDAKTCNFIRSSILKSLDIAARSLEVDMAQTSDPKNVDLPTDI